MSKISDPKYVGPGRWDVIHSAALRVTSPQTRTFFQELMRLILDSFHCSKCKGHLREFMRTHPYPRQDKDYFRWTWECHNAVNARLGKRQPSLAEAYELWSAITPCEDCGETTMTPLKTTPINSFEDNSMFPLVRVTPDVQ